MIRAIDCLVKSERFFPKSSELSLSMGPTRPLVPTASNAEGYELSLIVCRNCLKDFTIGSVQRVEVVVQTVFVLLRSNCKVKVVEAVEPTAPEVKS